MKKEITSLSVASQLAAISSQLGLIENYFSCIDLTHSLDKDWSVIHSLFNERGLNNVMETLEALGKEIVQASNELCDYDLVSKDEPHDTKLIAKAEATQLGEELANG